MKTITMPMYPGEHRYNYTKLSLESLRKNDLTGWKLFINIEPGPYLDDYINLCNDIDFIENHIHLNSELLDVRKNTFNNIDKAIKSGSEFNVTVPDDLIYAKDAFSLANWYFDTFKNNKNEYMYYGLFSFANRIDFPSNLYVNKKSFIGFGTCFFPHTWNDLWSKGWFSDELTHKHFSPKTNGWDWMLDALAKEHELKGMHPWISRTKHIGVYGRYSRPNHHAEVHNKIKINKDSIETKFKIVRI